MLTLKKRATLDSRIVYLPLIFFVGYLGSLTLLTKIHPIVSLDNITGQASDGSVSTAAKTDDKKNSSDQATSSVSVPSPLAMPASGSAGSTASPSTSTKSPTTTAPTAGSNENLPAAVIDTGSGDTTGSETGGLGGGGGGAAGDETPIDNDDGSTGDSPIIDIPILSPLLQSTTSTLLGE